jgi:U3 small nucleolar RNA-associated protein 20
LLHNLLKQNRLNEEKDEQKKEEPSKSENTANYKEMLEPYVPIFVDYLDGKYIKVTIITLRCLVAMLRFNLKSIEEKSSVLGTKLFSLLRTFSSASTTSTPSSSGDNFELLMVCYKLIACLIRDCTYFELSDDQLQTLLHCAERNLFDTHKQASTFNLLKAIVSRRFESDDLGEIMGRVMKLSIQAESPPVRAQSRQTVMSYLIAYAMGAGRDRDEKKFAKIVEFYVVQLNYEYENGRESAIEMLATMFNTFPTVSYRNTFTMKGLNYVVILL